MVVKRVFDPPFIFPMTAPYVVVKKKAFRLIFTLSKVISYGLKNTTVCSWSKIESDIYVFSRKWTTENFCLITLYSVSNGDCSVIKSRAREKIFKVISSQLDIIIILRANHELSRL